jgi:hypothetical protein
MILGGQKFYHGTDVVAFPKVHHVHVEISAGFDQRNVGNERTGDRRVYKVSFIMPSLTCESRSHASRTMRNYCRLLASPSLTGRAYLGDALFAEKGIETSYPGL